jgi:hypothetical protein
MQAELSQAPYGGIDDLAAPALPFAVRVVAVTAFRVPQPTWFGDCGPSGVHLMV